MAQAGRNLTFAWDNANRLESFTDTLHRSSSFDYDSADRLIAQHFSDGRTIRYAWDAHGNLLSLTPSDRPAHTFAFTDADLPERYDPPAVPGGGETRFGWNADHQLTSVTRPGGTLVGMSYDGGGRLSSVSAAGSILGYSYLPGGQLGAASISNGATVSYTWDGPLLLSTNWSGAVSASVGLAWDSNFRVMGETVNGNSIAFAYDGDGLLAQAGALTLTRDASNGLVTGTTLAASAETRTYNQSGETLSRAATVQGSTVFAEQFTRDDEGRIAARTETMYDSALETTIR